MVNTSVEIARGISSMALFLCSSSSVLKTLDTLLAYTDLVSQFNDISVSTYSDARPNNFHTDRGECGSEYAALDPKNLKLKAG